MRVAGGGVKIIYGAQGRVGEDTFSKVGAFPQCGTQTENHSNWQSTQL